MDYADHCPFVYSPEDIVLPLRPKGVLQVWATVIIASLIPPFVSAIVRKEVQSYIER